MFVMAVKHWVNVPYLKNIYDAEHAHIKAHESISQSRSGLCISEDEIARLNSIISPLVQKGNRYIRYMLLIKKSYV